MHTMFKALAVSAALTFLASGTAFAADRIELNAAAGNQGGVFYVGMGAVGNAIMQDNPDIDYSMFPSAGLTNIIRVQNNQSQIGVIQSNNGVMALKGLAPFKSPQKNITGLVNMNTRAHTHIVVTEASGITSMEDIRDKKLPIRININPSGGNNEMMPRLVFEAYGIGWNKLRENGAKLFPLSIPDSIDMMKDGRIDVDVYHGEEPAYKYTDIMSTVNIRFLDVDPEVVKHIADEYGMTVTEFSPEAYDGKAKGVRGLTSHTEIIANADMSEDLAYRITKAIVEHRQDIATAVPLWGTMTPEVACRTTVPLHPGAARYYREIGVLK
ncbi:TAXI family TRAP transporter solute-binding subunit [Mailhella massiliensis]|uniref:TAXI family TRAP transporter solute-binding subunit n=1 Tax=Mailhella massiliensis TaxID=1903261 RepID=UPI0023543A15|nr:TAXI family TRAP transporter solute-binding subunit [Mailhella massiliensis]